MGLLAEELYEALGHFARKDESGDLLKFCEAWAAPLERVYEVVRDRDDGRPGWAVLLSPTECPAESLPYLAQFVGVRIEPGWDEAQTRAEIASPTTWKRGQTETLRTALAATLTGTMKVIVKERTPEAHDLYIRTLLSETPDPARTEALARAQKVAGLLLDYEAFAGYTYADLNANHETYAVVDEAFATYGEILEASL